MSSLASPARPTRRAVLAVGGAVLLTACGGGAAAPKPSASAVPAPEVPLRLTTRWEGKPDGPLPRAGDDGVPIEIRLSGSDAAPTVRGGALVGNLPNRASAAYVQQTLGTRVNRIGARFGFEAGEPSGTVALLAYSVTPGLSGHCHFVFTPDRWIAGVLVDGTVVELRTTPYRNRLVQDGRPVTADVRFSGASAFVSAPDGTQHVLTDPRFIAPDGTIAVWEFYKNTAASAPARFYETWAG